MAKSSNTHGYIGASPTQLVTNTGVHSVGDALELSSIGHWGGSLELIEEQTFSGVNSVEFTNIKENVYDVHLIQVSNFTQNGGDNFGMRWLLSNDGGSTYETSNYQMAYFEIAPNGSSSENRSTSRAHFQNTIVTLDRDTSPRSVGGGYYYMYNAGNSSKYTFQTNQTSSGVGAVIGFSLGGAVYRVAETINAFKFDDGSSVYSLYGTIKLFGVKQ